MYTHLFITYVRLCSPKKSTIGLVSTSAAVPNVQTNQNHKCALAEKAGNSMTQTVPAFVKNRLLPGVFKISLSVIWVNGDAKIMHPLLHV